MEGRCESDMRAVDTNVILRLLTQDDAKQSTIAREIFLGKVWIAKSVLLEVVWGLRSVYGFEREQVVEAVSRLMGLRTVELEDFDEIASAVELAKGGLDLADAIHLMSRPAGTEFMSFDQKLVKRAKKLGVAAVEEAGLTGGWRVDPRQG